MAPPKSASVRYRGRTGALVPFRDDQLVALRYDQTKQAEPPIILAPSPPSPPPRSPLRYRSQSGTHPASSIFSRNPGALLNSPPPVRPPRPTETHPALRTITTPGANEFYGHDDDTNNSKRNSGHAPTSTSPQCFTFYQESDEDDDDPFPYENLNKVPRVRVTPELHVNVHDIPRALCIRNRASFASTSSENEHTQPPHAVDDLSGTNCSIPLSSPDLSESNSNSNTVSPTSPTTPISNFAEKPASIFSRSFSFRSSIYSKSSSMKSSRGKLQKKVHAPPHEQRSVDPAPSTATPPATPPPENGMPMTIHYPCGRETPLLVNDIPSPLESPNLHGGSPAPAGDGEFADFITQMSFSNRGSIMLGGKRPTKDKKPITMTNSDSATGHGPPARQLPIRAFPLAPSLMSKSQVDGAVASSANAQEPYRNAKNHVIAEEDETAPACSSVLPASPPVAAASSTPVPPPPVEVTASTSASPFAVDEEPSTPKSPQPPSIRVISVDIERESQKVRSLYESGEGLRWEDGGRLEPTVEVPSEDDDDDDDEVQTNDASPNNPTSPTTSQSRSPNDQSGSRIRAAGIPASVACTASRHDDSIRHAYELAGGIEDWEDVNGEDVDRYGFIHIRRPETPPRMPIESDNASVQYSPRKQRNVLVRKEIAYAGYLGARRGPSRKVSARSLNTQASEMSSMSRYSNRSAARQAANLLPHNRDRKFTDEAGEMLALQPGLSIGEDESAGKLAEEHKRKEWERAEKWRKMAKVVKPGKDGEGMVFEFDTKNPKLIERTWKGIPDMWRAAAWHSFLSTSARDSKRPLETDDELVVHYQTLQEQPSPDDVQIDLDVPRTINQHIMFRRRYRGGQRLLFRVLHALSLYFPETGYVQGMASLAATLLNYYDEERCFVMLVRLWQLRGLNRLYQPGFEELMGALKDFEKYWLADKDVAQKLQELSIDPTAYGTRWYLTLFNLSIPFPAQLRVWDVFMLLGQSPPDPPAPSMLSGKAGKGAPEPVSSQGLEILHATSTAIIHALHDQLIDSDFENAMKALTSWVPIKNEELLMKVVRVEYKQHMKSKKT